MGIDVNQVRTIGRGLTRPEGVMATDDGALYTADGLGRCTRIERDGRTAFFGNLGGMPNGICINGDANCIIANIAVRGAIHSQGGIAGAEIFVGGQSNRGRYAHAARFRRERQIMEAGLDKGLEPQFNLRL